VRVSFAFPLRGYIWNWREEKEVRSASRDGRKREAVMGGISLYIMGKR
jgi:hypothetical protein